MKKTYMAPRVEQVPVDSELPLCASGVGGGGGTGIGFGGVDTEGTLDPSAKEIVDFSDLL